ncbi:MAG TPA: hypothetical protein VGN95_23845 [Pyrinomonadaceae bacterium]|nr:hypothetical protein [Pyrinomonadaceae bacterium]
MRKREAPSVFVATRLADHLVEDAVNVPRAVEDAQHFDAIGDRLVEDDVVLDREAAQVHQQFVAGAAHLRVFGQPLTLLVDQIKQSVGPLDARLGNVVPDISKVLLGQRRDKNGRHLRRPPLACGQTLATLGFDALDIERLGLTALGLLVPSEHFAA